jgi:altronate dehydratase small subunit
LHFSLPFFLDRPTGGWYFQIKLSAEEIGGLLQFHQTLIQEDGAMAAKRALIMHPKDNVATTVEEIQPGDEVRTSGSGEVRSLTAVEAIPFGFKIALEEIPQGQTIVKYGETIGKAGRPIPRGALVHVHNLEGTRARGDLEGRGKK